jgi:hypothetical protein
MKMSDFRKSRGMPFVKRGMKVFSTYNNKHGVVTGANDSANLNIKFDDCNFSQNYHPWWKIKYFDSDGSTIKEYGG